MANNSLTTSKNQALQTGIFSVMKKNKPKNTQAPPDKKQEILNEAIKLFAENDYEVKLELLSIKQLSKEGESLKLLFKERIRKAGIKKEEIIMLAVIF